jgi:hypothetical protein
MSGRREEAVEHLVAAYRTARRLEARPLAGQVADGLAMLASRRNSAWAGARSRSSRTVA